jgi:hypothetical protein
VRKACPRGIYGVAVSLCQPVILLSVVAHWQTGAKPSRHPTLPLRFGYAECGGHEIAQEVGLRSTLESLREEPRFRALLGAVRSAPAY